MARVSNLWRRAAASTTRAENPLLEPPPALTPWLALGLAMVLRILIAIFGIGTNDVLLWQQFGRGGWTGAFFKLWETDSWMNHPPLPVAYATLAYAIAGEHLHAFSLLIKLPGLVGDLVSTLLIARIVSERAGSARAGHVAAQLFAMNPAALLITGYHGNVDPLLAMFSLLAWRSADRGHFGWAGLALGAAINVKLAAAPSVLLLLQCSRSRRQLTRAIGALLIAATPFALMIVVAGRPFLEQTLGYRPPSPSWLMLPLWVFRSDPAFGSVAMAIVLAHAVTILQCTLLLIVVLAWRWHRGRGWDLVTVGALYWSALLLWAGGVFQYTVWPLPLLAATRPRIALAYGICAGTWLAWAYHDACVARWPFQSLFFVTTQGRAHLAVALPVAALVVAVISLARGRSMVPPSAEVRRRADPNAE